MSCECLHKVNCRSKSSTNTFTFSFWEEEDDGKSVSCWSYLNLPTRQNKTKPQIRRTSPYQRGTRYSYKLGGCRLTYFSGKFFPNWKRIRAPNHIKLMRLSYNTHPKNHGRYYSNTIIDPVRSRLGWWSQRKKSAVGKEKVALVFLLRWRKSIDKEIKGTIENRLPSAIWSHTTHSAPYKERIW